MDLLVNVGRPTERELKAPPALSSAQAGERVALARERQRARLAGTGCRCNGEMDGRLVRRHVRLEDGAERTLGQAYSRGALSARGRLRVLRVARTIADLESSEDVSRAHLLTALGLRQRAGAETLLAA
jgi:magnesium chelatase family protein